MSNNIDVIDNDKNEIDVSLHNNIFAKIPNCFLYCNIKDFGVGKYFYAIYVYLFCNKNLFYLTGFSIEEIYNKFGIKYDKTNDSPLKKDIIKTLLCLEESGYIKIKTDLSKVKYNTYISIEFIDGDNFKGGYTSISYYDYIRIMQINDSKKFYCLFVYLYMKSFMKQSAYNASYDNTFSKRAFYRSLNNLINDTMFCHSRNKVNECIDLLLQNEILKKKSIKGVIVDDNFRFAPNIYVINDEYADMCMLWAKDELLKLIAKGKDGKLIVGVRNKNQEL